jgi:hypothetical protein
MGYSKDPELYPPEFQELYRRAFGERVELPCDYPQQATALRHQLHAFRRACEATKIPGWTELRQIQIAIEGSVVILHKNPILDMLRDVAGVESQHPSDDQLDQYIKQMEVGETKDEQS